MELKIIIIYGKDKDINIDEVPELLIIKEHIIEYYPDEKIYIFPYKDGNDIYADFHIDLRRIACTRVIRNIRNVWIPKIRHKKRT